MFLFDMWFNRLQRDFDVDAKAAFLSIFDDEFAAQLAGPGAHADHPQAGVPAARAGREAAGAMPAGMPRGAGA